MRRRRVLAVRQYFRRTWDAEALVNFDDVSPLNRRHLTNVYLSLVFALASLTVGSYLSLTGKIGNLFAVRGTFLSVFAFCFTVPRKQKKRLFFLTSAAFFGGAIFAPWYTWFFSVDQGSLVISLGGLALGFVCFWASSLWTTRFDQVYYRATYFSIYIFMIWVPLASFLDGHSAFWKCERPSVLPMIGFTGYVAMYSQELVLKSREGDNDYVKHAVTLFTDFPAVLIHFCKLTLTGAFRLLKRQSLHERNTGDQ